MKRRDFFGRLLGGFTALAVAPTVLSAATSFNTPPTQPALLLYPEAMTDAQMAYMAKRYIKPSVAHIMDEWDRKSLEMYTA